jgi:drug/metabolite transporter (DMT)-like permease
MGIFAVFLSAVFSTSKDIVSKKLAVRIDGTASTFASFAFALPFYVAILVVLWLRDADIFSFSGMFWLLVMLRAVTDVFAEWMKMYAFAHADIAVVSIAFSMSPLCVLALTPILTSDQPSLSSAVAVVLVVAGSVAAVYRPSHPDWAKQKKAILLAVGASFFFGINSIYDRLAMQEQRRDFAAAVMGGFGMTGVSALLLLPMVSFRNDRLVGMYVFRHGLLIRGLLEVAFMVSKLVAMQALAPHLVVGLQRVSLLLSIIAGRVIFKEGDFVRRMIGGMLILGGVAWMVWEQASSRE